MRRRSHRSRRVRLSAMLEPTIANVPAVRPPLHLAVVLSGHPQGVLVLRSHAAGSLRPADAGQKVTLAGWVARRRDHGGVIFIDLRDGSGVAQVVFRDAEVLAQAHRLRAEFCIAVDGVVEIRPEGNANAEIPTGEIEVNATSLTVLGESAPLPFQLDETAGEEARLKYRYLDLRREGPGNAIRLRSKVNAAARESAGRARLRGDRDADVDPVNARGCPRLPGARPVAAGVVLRTPAEPAAVQAAADGGGHGALLPDRALLPRRGLPCRPAAGVHPARPGDELRRRRRRHRVSEEIADGAVGADRLRAADAHPANDVRRGDASFGSDKPDLRFGLELVDCTEYFTDTTFRVFQAPLRRRCRHAGRCIAAAPHARRLAGIRQAARPPRVWRTCSSPRTARSAGRWPRTCPTPSATDWRRTSAPPGDCVFFAAGPAKPSRALLGRDADRDRQATRPDRPGRVGVHVGRRLAAVRADRRGDRRRRRRGRLRRVDGGAPRVHLTQARVLETPSTPTRAMRWPTPTTSSATATRSAAARSVSIVATSRSRCSR